MGNQCLEILLQPVQVLYLAGFQIVIILPQVVGFFAARFVSRGHVPVEKQLLGIDLDCSQVPVLERDFPRGFRTRTLWYSATEEVYLHSNLKKLNCVRFELDFRR